MGEMGKSVKRRKVFIQRSETMAHTGLYWLAGLFLLLSLAGCKTGASAPLVLTEKDAGTTISLNQGDTLVVALDGNITTGYTWEMLPMNPAVLQQVGIAEVTPDTAALGAGGKIALKFLAVKSGQAPLQLVYRRSFEQDVAPAKTFEVNVKVK
jgi:inhibitor of cysteine peptidase